MLSACSSFFKTILKKNTHSHPLIYLSGVNSANLGFILDYIYEGEVQIYQEELDNFLDAAQKLKIKGLISDIKVQEEGLKQEKNIDLIADQKIEELTDRINGVWTCKACGKTSQRKRDLGWHIETHLEGLSFSCNDCDKTFRSRNVLLSHKHKNCKKSFL